MVRSAGLMICLLSWTLALPAAQSGPRDSADALTDGALAAVRGAHFQDADFSMSGRCSPSSVRPTRDVCPDLIAPEEAVSTLAVSAILAVEKTDGRSRQSPERDRFVERVLEQSEKLRQPPNHVKWREVAISAPLDGWTRFPPAEQWLKNYPGDGPLEGGNQ